MSKESEYFRRVGTQIRGLDPVASSTTSCLRASKRVTAIARVNPSSRPRTPMMPAWRYEI
jgi:hypothetical protein